MIANATRLSSFRILCVSIIGGFLDGLHLAFVAALNCVIGARGSGKSTALEFIRYALDLLPSRDTDAAERRRIETLVERNLAGGRVQVTIETSDGLQYVVSRAAGEEPTVLTLDGKPTEITLKTGSLFRADIYSQNEVETIADRTLSQLELLDGFEPERIAEVAAQIAQTRSELATNASQIQPLETRLDKLAEELATLPEIETRLAKFSVGGGQDAEVINRAHTAKALRDRERRTLTAAMSTCRSCATNGSPSTCRWCNASPCPTAPKFTAGHTSSAPNRRGRFCT